METYIAGTALTIKIIIQKGNPDPFGTFINANPDNGAKVTFMHVASGYKAVDSISMGNSSTGKYFYNWKTVQTERTGKWNMRIDSDGAVYDGIREMDFILKAPTVTV